MKELLKKLTEEYLRITPENVILSRIKEAQSIEISEKLIGKSLKSLNRG